MQAAGPTRGLQPDQALCTSEEPIGQVPQEAFECRGDVIHMLLALFEVHRACILPQALQESLGLRGLAALAVDTL